MDFNKQDTAIAITDPQNDFLSPEGVIWGLVGASASKRTGPSGTSKTCFALQIRRATKFSSRRTITTPRTRVGSSVERLKT